MLLVMEGKPNKEQVAIIGAGIAGLEAAHQLLRLGYAPVLIEQADHAGGHVAEWNRLFPDKAPAAPLVEELLEQTREATLILRAKILSAGRLGDGFNIRLSDGTSLHVRAILMATGFSLFEAWKKEEYGYGVYDRVLTNADLEHWFNTGEDPRIKGDLKRIGFVHCVGSRDVKAGNTQCSKVCCITAIKQAIEMKERFPEAEIWCFYMDLRLFGKKYEDFYIGAQRDYGIHFIRGRVSEVSENIDGKVIVKAEDTLNGTPVKVTLDALVLMAGMVCNRGIQPLAKELSLSIDDDGYLKSRDNIGSVTRSDRKGIFLAGAATGPKTIPETLAEARSAALDIHNFLSGR